MDIVEQQLHVIKEKLISKDGEIIELHPDVIEVLKEDLQYIQIVKNKEEKERKKTFYDMQKVKTEFSEYINKTLGSFYFYFYNKIPKNLSKQYKIRFLYLCCYLKYNDPLNRIVIGNTHAKKQYVLEKDLMSLLRLKKREYQYTRKILIENNLITINDDKTISLNREYSYKGKLNKKTIKNDFTRIFENGLKEIYEKSLPSEHKKIGLLIEILPFVNYSYNILCANPEEPDINFIKTLNIKNLCDIVGYSKSNYSKLKKELLKITINEEPAIMISDTLKNQTITVNPKLYYKGNNLESLQSIINYFYLKNTNTVD